MGDKAKMFLPIIIQQGSTIALDKIEAISIIPNILVSMISSYSKALVAYNSYAEADANYKEYRAVWGTKISFFKWENPPKDKQDFIERAIQEHQFTLDSGRVPNGYTKRKATQAANAFIFAINEYKKLLTNSSFGKCLNDEQRGKLKEIRKQFIADFPNIEAIRGTEMHYDERIEGVINTMHEEVLKQIDFLKKNSIITEIPPKQFIPFTPYIKPKNELSETDKRILGMPSVMPENSHTIDSPNDSPKIISLPVRSEIDANHNYSSTSGNGKLETISITEDTVLRLNTSLQSVFDLFEWYGQPIIHPTASTLLPI